MTALLRTLAGEGDPKIVTCDPERCGVGGKGIRLGHSFQPFFGTRALSVRLRISARLNSFATFCGMPAARANFAECAAAAMKRRCLADVEGTSAPYIARVPIGGA